MSVLFVINDYRSSWHCALLLMVVAVLYISLEQMNYQAYFVCLQWLYEQNYIASFSGSCMAEMEIACAFNCIVHLETALRGFVHELAQ